MTLTTKSNRDLPTKESALFKSAIKFYEYRQYKKAVKVCDQILKKSPEHGETKAVKGLCLCHLDKKVEGLQLIKSGLKNDLASHICWHVYGLYYRQEKNYTEAIQCYKKALKYDPENTQIIKDLSLLQIQVRQMSGYIETRKKMLDMNPTLMNWIALAVGYHLNGQPEKSLNIFEAFEIPFKEELITSLKTSHFNYQYSEILLYKFNLLEICHQYEKILKEIELYKVYLVDSITVDEFKARCYKNTGKLKAANDLYLRLLTHNPNNISYLEMLESLSFTKENLAEYITTEKIQSLKLDATANGLEDEMRIKEKMIMEYFMNWKTLIPKSDILAKRPLDLLNIKENFIKVLETYALPFIQKGIPSLFLSLKSMLTKNPKKLEYCQEYFENLLQQTLHGDATLGDHNKDETAWIHYYLASHYDHLRNIVSAIKHIDHAIEMSPSTIEFYLLKSKICKHGGDLKYAIETLDKVRRMDSGDRYLNCKLTKYYLLNGQITEAETTVSLFIKGETLEAKLRDLIEMQCFWYLYLLAKSHLKFSQLPLNGMQIGKILKVYHLIYNIYNEILDDQFDFHNYVTRRMTLRNYVALLNFEDGLTTLKDFKIAFIGIVKYLIALFDNPLIREQIEERGKVVRQPSVKAIDMDENEEPQNKNELEALSNPNSYKKKEVPVDEDPHGLKYIRDGNYLEQAEKFVKLLIHSHSNDYEAVVVICHYYLRKRNWKLVLEYLSKAKQLKKKMDGESMDLAIQIIQIDESENSKKAVEECREWILHQELNECDLTDLPAFSRYYKKDEFESFLICCTPKIPKDSNYKDNLNAYLHLKAHYGTEKINNLKEKLYCVYPLSKDIE